ncbi:uncharacterized protein LOC130401538 isoform X2 [Gadus chalcogrammus]|uniref:uncharacterized protein LOC130387858 isoform X2 n=1 Tax=Gadus chalcogrammus TaxID=1042646 RepID=UPI0024C48F28|nr:uncharacterized protein LOC130387858 isoform X2 [Gadus chalcogrammus]XP_056453727.1 uncharacterized protein LOC130388304 isoform X2 [Gadus chalcogrammus]XP_056461330.1 uncharacterized protein LOC130401538 isoform X2 [Gadus chalcogrammus]
MTKPKKKRCPSCQAENSVGRKTCCQCLLPLPRKNKLPDNLQMDSWASSAKSYRNGARAINSAQLSVLKLNALGRKPLLFLGNPGRKGKSVGDLIHFIPTDNVLVKDIISKMSKCYELLLTMLQGCAPQAAVPPLENSGPPAPPVCSQPPPEPFSSPQTPPSFSNSQPPPSFSSPQTPPSFSNSEPPPSFHNLEPPPSFSNSQPPSFSSPQTPPSFSNSQPPSFSSPQTPPSFSNSQPPSFSNSQPPPSFSDPQTPPSFSNSEPPPSFHNLEPPPSFSNSQPPSFSNSQPSPSFSNSQPPSFSNSQPSPSFSPQPHPSLSNFEPPRSPASSSKKRPKIKGKRRGESLLDTMPQVWEEVGRFMGARQPTV